LALLDDQRARRFARRKGIRVTGTLGILLKAKQSGRLKLIQPLVDRLEGLGFRLDPLTRKHVLDLSGEGDL
jgi:predicted nucleic acid-binding protein